MIYGYSLWYHPNDAPAEREISNEQGPGFPSEEQRDADLLKRVSQLEAQDYRVYRVACHVDCGRCQGTDSVRVPPKSWRKRSAPPWFMCKLVECPRCRGRGRTVERDVRLNADTDKVTSGKRVATTESKVIRDAAWWRILGDN